MSEAHALMLAALSAICFGTALVSAKFGLRALDARSGAAISIPTATVLLVLAAPFALDVSGFTLTAALIFAAVGLFFPALVTLITFAANDRLGPSVTATVSSTAPLFALLAALLILGERIPARALVATGGVVAGVALLSWRGGTLMRRALWLPVAGAALRGLVQVVVKAGLALWPNPFAASLIGYGVSSVTVTLAARGRQRLPERSAVLWFMATGLLNGLAVLLMYAALSAAPVSLVAPLVAGYPLVTVLLGAALLHEERLTVRSVAGALLIVGAIAYLVAG
ncbi:MAG: DMT family transporter [Betaproteobacteria bacterium]|nr:MAG: DMT family transporter [Betaproteobacteria bacterium]